MSYKLFLDDERIAPDDTWVTVRSCDEAIDFISKNGWPSFITFDHDLGYKIPDEMLETDPSKYPFVKTQIGYFRKGIHIEKTGYDFAKWLVEYSSLSPMPRDFGYAIHSANPVGAKNIKELMQSHFKKEPVIVKINWWKR